MKKLVSLLLTLAMMTAILSSFVVVASAANSPVTFRYPVYNDAGDPTKGIKEWKEETIENYTVVTNYDSKWTTGYYVVNKDTFIGGSGVRCEGNVRLILKDGCTLTITTDTTLPRAGICVTGDNSLNIYAQSTDTDTMGKLTVTGGKKSAAIGGANEMSIDEDVTKGRNITINGGYITAKVAHSGSGAAAIGGECGHSGQCILINGGYVVADAGDSGGAGIGGGIDGNGEWITINGGEVHATGGKGDSGCAGIGGGDKGFSRAITINGGIVYATGKRTGAGIGGGGEENGFGITINGGYVIATGGDSGGAGIGGGDDNDGYEITITGGYVVANGGQNAAGIGGGEDGDGKTIKITGGVVYAAGKNGGAAIGGGDDGEADDIQISGGYVRAESVKGNGCTGIGGGCDGKGTNITITGGYIEAYAGYEGAAIGGGKDEYGGNIYISNAYVYASGSGAAAIGGGKGGSYKNICVGKESLLIENGVRFGVGSGLSSDIGILIVEYHGKVEIKAPAAKSYDENDNVTYYYSIAEACKAASSVNVIRDDAYNAITISADSDVMLYLNGHGIYCTTSSPIINNGTFEMFDGIIADASDTNKPENGGNICNYGTMILNSVDVIGGKASSNGGNIYNSGTMKLIASEISDGNAKCGGNIYNCGTLKITSDTTVTGGVSDSNGGNVYNDKNGNLTVDYAEITCGLAKDSGGGIYNAGTLDIDVFERRGCDGETGDTEISTINSNYAKSFGGGVFNTKTATFKYTDGEITGNRAGKSNSNLIYHKDTKLDMSIGAIQYTYIIDDNNKLTSVEYVPQSGSVFSDVTLWVIIAGAVILAAAVVFVIIRGKKQKVIAANTHND